MRSLKYISFYLLPVIILLCSSCKKDEPQPQTGDPVFYAGGTIGGQPFRLDAGVNDYYMYSTCPSDANTIYEYTGQLKQRNCSSCPSSLTVRIRDYRDHILLPTSVDSALRPSLYNFNTASSLLNVAFTSITSIYDTVFSYTWSFGATNANPSLTFPSTGSYWTTLSIFMMHNNVTCTATASDTVRVTSSPPCMTVDFTAIDADVNFPGLDSLQFVASVAGGIPPYTYSWDFGDSNTGTGNSTINGYATPAIYPVTLTVTDGGGCHQERRKNVRTPNNDSALVNFDWQQVSALNLSTVAIEWIDANGNLYSSAGGVQPGTSSFRVVSAEEYQPNENQEPTKKVHMLVSCTLFNGMNTLLLENADIVFAFAHH